MSDTDTDTEPKPKQCWVMRWGWWPVSTALWIALNATSGFVTLIMPKWVYTWGAFILFTKALDFMIDDLHEWWHDRVG